MRTGFLHAVLIISFCQVHGQQLYVPANSTVFAGPNVGIQLGGRLENAGIIELEQGAWLTMNDQLENDGSVSVGSEANLQMGGNLENDGSIQNLGIVALGGDWNNRNIFNGISGGIRFIGNGTQQVFNSQLFVQDMVVDAGGTIVLSGDSVKVYNRLVLLDGILTTNNGTRLILESNSNPDGGDAMATGGSEDSYFDGNLIVRGTGYKYFPVGNNGHFGPLIFENIYGSSDLELTVSHLFTNPESPRANRDIIGVSGNGVWEVAVTGGEFDSTLVTIDFYDEDLENFVYENEIKTSYKSPAVAFADSIGGTYRSLGVGYLEATDSLTYGVVTSELALRMEADTTFLAVAMVPLVPPGGVHYLPNAFSPNASDPSNQNFRVFGEGISPENFLVEIYNKYRERVYATTNLQEANQIGWNGINQQNGKEEPSGVYYYHVVLTRDGKLYNESGPVYLHR